MVSLGFKGKKSITESPLFERCVQTCRKVEKLQFIDFQDVDLPFMNIFHSVLTDPVNEHFLGRVHHLTLVNIQFNEDNQTEMQRCFAIGKFCQALAYFSRIDTLEFENVSHISQIIRFMNNISEDRLKFLQTVTHLNFNACPILEDEHD